MPVEVILPMLGETMDEGTIVKWLARPGQVVEKGRPLYQVETDKAILDVEAPASGVLREVLVEEGVKVRVLSVIGVIAGADEDVGAWSSSPAGNTHPKPPSGKGGAPVGAALSPSNQKRLVASPRARKVALERKVDLALVKGSGPGGRIVESDVLRYIESVPASTPVTRKMAAEAGLDLVELSADAEGRRISRADVEARLRSAPSEMRAGAAGLAFGAPIRPFSGLREIIARRMSTSAHTSASVTLTTEADATELVKLRTLLKDRIGPELGFSPSYNDLLVAMVARALLEFPYMNSRLTETGIQLLREVNVGVAVDTERGLLVPVIRDADRKGVAEIARVFHELAERARAGKSTPDDLTGGTFTLTNLGMFEIDAFTPIINLPECAIMGVGRIREQPVVREGQLCIGQMLALSLTFDHRIVDGAPAARFLQRIKQIVEQPYLMLA